MTKEISFSHELASSTTSYDNTAHNLQVKRMFGSIARGYDFLNHTLSMGFDIYWRRALVASVAHAPEGVIMDLAAGTFDVSLALAKTYRNRKILAADLCLPMLRQGLPKLRKQARAEGRNSSRIRPVTANAFNLPLPDNSVAAITVSFGLRNMVPHLPALAEMQRVLVPGGKLSVLEFGSSRNRVWMGFYNFYLDKILPKVGGLLSGDRGAYEYLARTIQEFPTAQDLALEMQAAGFEGVEFRKMSGGIVYLHTAHKL